MVLSVVLSVRPLSLAWYLSSSLSGERGDCGPTTIMDDGHHHHHHLLGGGEGCASLTHTIHLVLSSDS